MSLPSYRSALNPVSATLGTSVGRGRELMTRGASGPVVIEIKYRERPRNNANYLSSCGSGGTRGSRKFKKSGLHGGEGNMGDPSASWSTTADKGKQLAVSFLIRMIRGWIPHSFHQIRSLSIHSASLQTTREWQPFVGSSPAGMSLTSLPIVLVVNLRQAHASGSHGLATTLRM